MSPASSLLAIFLAALGWIFAATANATEIVIAVRDDAPPFIWQDADRGDHHMGFFWDICTKAVERADYTFRAEVINADVRKSFLRVGKPKHYDLLCDPTTITLARLEVFSDRGLAPYLAFSPIIFVANGTYVNRRRGEDTAGKGWGEIDEDVRDLPDACPKLLMRWRDGTLDQKTDHLQSGQPWIRFRPEVVPQSAGGKPTPKEKFQIWGYVDGSTIGEKLERAKEEGVLGRDSNVLVCAKGLPSHSVAAEKFCTDHLERYFGDSEIVRAAIEQYTKRTGKTCEFNSGPTGGTYEPYAFVTSSLNQPEFPERFTGALYSMFADQTIEGLFRAHFPDAKKSDYLATLFRINSIPPGRSASVRRGGVRAPEQIAGAIRARSTAVSR